MVDNDRIDENNNISDHVLYLLYVKHHTKHLIFISYIYGETLIVWHDPLWILEL